MLNAIFRRGPRGGYWESLFASVRAYRRFAGGEWYLVQERSAGWPISGWSRYPAGDGLEEDELAREWWPGLWRIKRKMGME